MHTTPGWGGGGITMKYQELRSETYILGADTYISSSSSSSSSSSKTKSDVAEVKEADTSIGTRSSL